MIFIRAYLNTVSNDNYTSSDWKIIRFSNELQVLGGGQIIVNIAFLIIWWSGHIPILVRRSCAVILD
jgi:hypothetical protein